LETAVQAQRISGLDGVRAIAVLLVFAHHTNNLARSLEFGTMGVWAFFVLSGFLIIRILHAQRINIETGQDTAVSAWKTFLRRRTLRIFPIYYLVLAICAILTLFGPLRDYSDGQWSYYWSYLTNVYIQITGRSPGSFVHLWSLAVEEQFYLLAAPLFLLMPLRLAPYLCGLIVILGIARGVAVLNSATAYADSLFSFYMLALGGIAGLTVSRIEPRTATVALMAAATVMICALGANYAMSKSFSTAVLLFPFFAATLYGFIYLRQSSTLVRLLDCWPLRNLGRISYGFYLYHNFVKLEYIRPALGIAFEPSNKTRVAIEFIITLAVATLSWIAIERPLLSRKT